MVTKGIIFAGCSFTWGSGLWYYSKLPTIVEQYNQSFDSRKMNACHIKYMESVRFPRIVSNKLNTFDIVNPNNGGSNQSIINWWDMCFKNGTKGYFAFEPVYPYIDYNEVSHIVFQLTQWHRNSMIIDDNGVKIEKGLFDIGKNISDIESFSKFAKEHIEKNLQMVKSFLIELNQKGISPILMSWPDEYISLIENDDWLNSIFLTFDYNSKNYKSIESLIKENKNLSIKYDNSNFHNPPDDDHPSLECHKIIANNILKKFN